MINNTERFSERRGLLALWFGLVAAPAAWAFQLLATYVVVNHICDLGLTWPLHLATVLSVILALAGGFVAWRNWKALGSPREARGGGVIGRSYLLAIAGMALSAFFTLIILAAEVPSFFFSTCVQP